MAWFRSAFVLLLLGARTISACWDHVSGAELRRAIRSAVPVLVACE